MFGSITQNSAKLQEVLLVMKQEKREGNDHATMATLHSAMADNNIYKSFQILSMCLNKTLKQALVLITEGRKTYVHSVQGVGILIPNGTWKE